MSQTFTPFFTPIAKPAVKRKDIPAAVAGAFAAGLITGYASSRGLYCINPMQANLSGSMSFHLTSLLKSTVDMLNGGYEGYASKYWLATKNVGLSNLWRVELTYLLSILASAFTYKYLAQEIDPILHYRGRKLVKPSVINDESKRESKREGGAVVRLGEIIINKERINRSIGIIGATGGGKTVCVNSILKDLDLDGYSLLIVDGPKGDFASADGFYLNALRIAPWHAGAVWDIAKDCPTRAAARELAKRLIPSNEKDPFWSNCAQFVFIGAACFLIETRGKNWGWRDLWDACNVPVETMKERADSYYPPASAVFLDAESKTTLSILINTTAFLADIFEMSEAWGNAPKEWIRFSFIDWLLERGESGKQRHVIIQTSGEWQSTSKAFCSGVLGLLSQIVISPSLKESNIRKKAFTIDEAAQQGRIDGLQKFIEVGRSKGVSLIIATQSPAQLREIYGQDQLNSWFAMLGIRIFARILGDDDQQWVSRQLGKREIDTPTSGVSMSANGFTTSSSYQRGEEWVIHPSDLQKLGPNEKLGGVKVVLDGWDDVTITTVKYPHFKAVREPFILNPYWNIATHQKENAINELNNNLVEPSLDKKASDDETTLASTAHKKSQFISRKEMKGQQK